MRAGLCTVQQALTPEAASIVKQAVSLARRRGHAQVTPLHVASSMLASSASLLRRACLQSHSHPLQCKALELCFNVALNRLPASTSSPLLSPHSPLPSLSNALVAAFKRAQAHQRRGSIESQQQPILALKIELEQLIISILDDPSVSRVMREAGFSSTQVKNNVEKAVSLEICSQSPSVSSQPKESTKPPILCPTVSQSATYSHLGLTVTVSKPFDQVRNDDVTSVLNTFLSKRRNTVIVGESLAITEAVVRGVMDKFEKGHVPGDLRYLQFISLPLFSLKNLSKEEVEQKVMELRCLVKSYMSRGVILYLGDLKWVSEFWSSYGEQRRNYYCPVEHIIMELKRMVAGSGEHGRLWLMGIATFQTHMKCKAGFPSLETIWELHPVTIPTDNLSLSLNFDSDSQSQYKSKVSKDVSCWPLRDHTGPDKHLSHVDSAVYLNREVQSLPDSHLTISTTSSLPSWLQKYKEESRRNTSKNQGCVNVLDLCKQWDSFCSSVEKQPLHAEKDLKNSSQSPCSSTSISSHDQNTNLNPSHLVWPAIFEPKQLPKEHQFWVPESADEGIESHLATDPKPDLLSNPNSSPNSASSSEAVEEDTDGLNMFKELNTENLSVLCSALEKKVPWQKEILPDIVSTILKCRSGMSKKKRKLKHREQKEETWLFFFGADSEGKEKISRELARLIFGSQSNFVSIGLSSFSSKKADSTEESSKKRRREEIGSSYLERFGEALNENPHRVFFMEDLKQVSYYSQKGIKQAIESGNVILPGGETVPLKDAIIIFSCESFSSVSRACSPSRRQRNSEDEAKEDENNQEKKNPVFSLDLNIAIEDNNGDAHSDDDTGILESVDRQILFQNQKCQRRD